MKVNKKNKIKNKKHLKKKNKYKTNDNFVEEILEKTEPQEAGSKNSDTDSEPPMETETDIPESELAENEQNENSSEEQLNEEEDRPNDEIQNVENNNEQKKRKKGIVYVSNIPKHMNVTRIREYLGQYGDINRVYLQPEKFGVEKQKNKKKRLARHFTEGWVEFASKRAAKKVPELLNNTNIGTRKKSQFYDSLWSIKYLPRFKWVHLTERLNYEQAVYKQRLRAEVSQARKEATFFQNNLDKSEFIKKQNKKAKSKTKTELKT